MINSLTINAARLEDFTRRFAQFGKTARGGVTRLALSEEDKQARILFSELMTAIDCSIRIDAIGNMFARYEGKNPELDPVLIGSHGDSQPQGGRYDGIYGVVAAIEVLYTLYDHGLKPARTIDLVMWTNEEGARFAPAVMGSGVFSGAFDLEEIYAVKDQAGITVKEALDSIGYAGTDDFSDYKAHAALEIHIEQGPVLESHHNLVGVVTGAFGQRWYEVTFSGVAGHAGTTPMDLRKDALLGCARAIEYVHQVGLAEQAHSGRATVGMVSVEPGSRNVIPGKVWFTVEFRHPDNTVLEVIHEHFMRRMAEIAEEIGLTAQIERIINMTPIQFDAQCIAAVEESAKALSYSYEPIISGAGHDACNLSKIMPTGMIFIPCIEGISHNEAEAITPQWSAAGGNMLLHATWRLAHGE